jgi:hypothetical protein
MQMQMQTQTQTQPHASDDTLDRKFFRAQCESLASRRVGYECFWIQPRNTYVRCIPLQIAQCPHTIGLTRVATGRSKLPPPVRQIAAISSSVPGKTNVGKLYTCQCSATELNPKSLIKWTFNFRHESCFIRRHARQWAIPRHQQSRKSDLAVLPKH